MIRRSLLALNSVTVRHLPTPPIAGCISCLAPVLWKQPNDEVGFEHANELLGMGGGTKMSFTGLWIRPYMNSFGYINLGGVQPCVLYDSLEIRGYFYSFLNKSLSPKRNKGTQYMDDLTSEFLMARYSQ